MGSDPFSPDRGRGPEMMGQYQPPMTATGRPGRDFDFQRNQGRGYPDDGYPTPDDGYPDDEYHESQRPSVEYRAPSSSSQIMPPRPVPAPVEYPSRKNNARNYIPTGRNDSEYYDRVGPRNVPQGDPQGMPKKPPPPPTISPKSSGGIFQDYLGIPKSSQNSSVSTSTASKSNSISKPNQYFLENQYRSLSSERRGSALSLPVPVPAPKPTQQRPSPETDLSVLINKTQKSMNYDDGNGQKSGDNLDRARRKIQSMEPSSSRWSANPAFLDSNYMDDVYKGKEIDKLGFAVRSNPELMTSVNPTSNQDRRSLPRDQGDGYGNQQRRIDSDRSPFHDQR